MTHTRTARHGVFQGDRPNCAVIDIGSNTVRLVVYGGSRRAPTVWLNEKATARLGRDLATTGKLPKEAIDLALSSLARFAAILSDLGVKDVQTVATAAVRDAANGGKFLEQVRKFGLDPRLLSGEEEACTSAFGVLGAFPGAEGVVADMGGGSLELVAIAKGDCRHGVSLPLGTLRLPALRKDGAAAFRKVVKKELTRADWAKKQKGPLYMVGGTWRAFASFAMHKDKYPLSDPHAFALTVENATKIAKKLEQMEPDKLTSIDGISSSRAAGLPDAAAMLRVVLSTLKPDGLVFSSWGLREGLLFQQLEPAAKEQDPLLTALAHFVAPRGATMNIATIIAGWTAGVSRMKGREAERLRLAAILLALAQIRLEPNMRLRHSIDWAMDKRWVGLDHRGRAMIAAALRGACNRPEPTPQLLQLAEEADLIEAASWGLAIRLCRRIGAGSRASVLTSRLERDEGRLILWLDESRAELAADNVRADLAALAKWLNCEPELRIGES